VGGGRRWERERERDGDFVKKNLACGLLFYQKKKPSVKWT